VCVDWGGVQIRIAVKAVGSRYRGANALMNGGRNRRPQQEAAMMNWSERVGEWRRGWRSRRDA
jgi:hypothetical protein